MGFQITVMLTLVVYIEGLGNDMPIMQDMSQAPRLLHFFVANIVAIAASMIVTTASLVFSHAAKGFEMTKWQAWFCIKCADGLNRIPCVSMPPSSIPPYLFRVIEQIPPADPTPQSSCCGFDCWLKSYKPDNDPQDDPIFKTICCYCLQKEEKEPKTFLNKLITKAPLAIAAIDEQLDMAEECNCSVMKNIDQNLIKVKEFIEEIKREKIDEGKIFVIL